MKKNQVVYINRQANKVREKSGLNADQLIKILPDNFDHIRNNCLVRGEVIHEIEPSDQDTYFLWSFCPLKEQKVVHCHGMDISDQKKAQQALVHQANYDSLTDLANRALAMDRLEQAILRAKREHKFAGCMFIILDQFKTINDSFGHLIGDLLLT